MANSTRITVALLMAFMVVFFGYYAITSIVTMVTHHNAKCTVTDVFIGEQYHRCGITCRALVLDGKVVSGVTPNDTKSCCDILMASRLPGPCQKDNYKCNVECNRYEYIYVIYDLTHDGYDSYALHQDDTRGIKIKFGKYNKNDLRWYQNTYTIGEHQCWYDYTGYIRWDAHITVFKLVLWFCIIFVMILVSIMLTIIGCDICGYGPMTVSPAIQAQIDKDALEQHQRQNMERYRQASQQSEAQVQ